MFSQPLILSTDFLLLFLKHKSPFEALYSSSPSLSHLRAFGCLAYATQTHLTDKFQHRAIPALFVGYSLSQKGYKLYDLQSKIFFVSRDVTFQEHIFPFHSQNLVSDSCFPYQSPSCDDNSSDPYSSTSSSISPSSGGSSPLSSYSPIPHTPVSTPTSPTSPSSPIHSRPEPSHSPLSLIPFCPGSISSMDSPYSDSDASPSTSNSHVSSPPSPVLYDKPTRSTRPPNMDA